ncbi:MULTISPECIES: 5'-methylthioadenosine/S-adenosylhomocysteine nucleosidase [Halomonadaceae]|uniref:5'-methylthioadenosine/S-adenosylhomocysteine nucleosidase n=1 Tax=Halomonadaceae TaxID=28256 RepID=UPI0015996BEB|nr:MULTISPECIES: 5'-methylthioadenosine/S-adenosylhomocysteine nucleosidase [Halomonas]QJQ94391.1 5'-methylthioadenosine/S-adenosylhomocysteine nucleosidase [Halomonas sp. PA5]
MKTIGIIGAMAEEVELLASRLTEHETRQHAGFIFHTGSLHDVKVIILQSGIGKVNAAVGTSQLLDKYQPEAIINTGSAGGFGEDLAIGDVVISSEVRHHDVDVVAFGYDYGQVPRMPAAYLPDPRLVQAARECSKRLDELRIVEGLIATGDSFMSCPESVKKTRERFPAMLAAEMEAAAIAQTCHLYDCPFVVIRALSDIAGQESDLSFAQFIDQAATHSAALVDAMVKHLGTSSTN